MKTNTLLLGLIISLFTISINAQNLLVNGDFTNGITSWEKTTGGTGSGSLNIVTDDGNDVAILTTSTIGTAAYEVQILQNNITLGKSRLYSLTFRAKSSFVGNEITTSVGLSVSPYNTYFNNKITLSDVWENYTVTFSTPDSWFPDTVPSNHQLAFQCGLQEGDVYIDDVLLTTIPNQVLNSDFNNATTSWSMTPSVGAAGTFELIFEGDNSVAKVSSTTLGSAPYDIQLVQYNLILGQNRLYTLSFMAKTNVAGNQIKASVGLSISPYSTYFNNTITLSETWTNYTVDFSTETAWFPVTGQNNHLIALQCGVNLGDFYFDDVKVIELPSADAVLTQIKENNELYAYDGVIYTLNPNLTSTYIEIYSLLGSVLKKGNLDNGQISIKNIDAKVIIIRYKDENGGFKSQLLTIN